MLLPRTTPLPLLTGPLLLGHLFNWGLFGVLTVQVYIYYIAFPKDQWRLKGIVIVVYSLELLQIVLSTHGAFRVYGSGWGDETQLNDIGLYWLSIPIVAGLISACSQFFYAWRIYVLSRSFWMPSIVSFISFVQASFGIYAGALSVSMRQISDYPQTIVFPISIVWLGGSALCDLVITCSMFHYLRNAKRWSTFRRTHTLLTRLIKLSVETGFLCAATTTTGLILFIVSRNTDLYAAPNTMASKLYSNCLIAVLNSRVRILGGRDDASRDDDVYILNAPPDTQSFGVTIEISREVHIESSCTSEETAIEKFDTSKGLDFKDPISPSSPNYLYMKT